jgi:hypothetical protein
LRTEEVILCYYVRQQVTDKNHVIGNFSRVLGGSMVRITFGVNFLVTALHKFLNMDIQAC